jgi:pyrroline-5-carboxylate reductase
MKLGFIGAGNIGSAIITGISTCTNPPEKILVFDPDRERCRALEQRFEQVEALSANQEVLNNADYVFLCVLPQIAPQVLLPLDFRKEQIVVSVIAVRSISEIKEYVSPAQVVIRAVPLPPIAKHRGPFIYYPAHDKISKLFSGTAQAIAVNREEDLIILSAITGLIAPYYSLVHSIAVWAANSGVDEKLATEYSLAMLEAQSYQAIENNLEIKELIEEVATPGGLNEQALRWVTNQNGFEPFLGALDALLQRLGLEVPERSAIKNQAG